MQKIKQMFRHHPEQPQDEAVNQSSQEPVYSGKHVTERVFTINPEASSHVQMEGLGGKPSAIREDKEKEKAKNKILQEFQMKKDIEKAEEENGRKLPPTLPQGTSDKLSHPLLPPGSNPLPTKENFEGNTSASLPSTSFSPAPQYQSDREELDQQRLVQNPAPISQEKRVEPQRGYLQEEYVSPFPGGNPLAAYYLSQESQSGPQLAPPPAAVQKQREIIATEAEIVAENRAPVQYVETQQQMNYESVDRKAEIDRIKMQVLNQQIPFVVNSTQIPSSRPVV
eukprot:TRINITY_DN3637_c0_g1_i1.p1 TRINITY_DN3637_c0_g1~~TRINITY_DN3637_c0_g1_i1.p1  ORF type:complete len:282 (-),score=113.86 TRINITY_DN3637_c0_g1_i1:50-895(-)